MVKKVVLLLYLAVFATSMSVYAGTLDWVRSWEFEFNKSQGARITQPANPIGFTVGSYEGVLHMEPVEVAEAVVLTIGVKIPFTIGGPYTYGVFADYNEYDPNYSTQLYTYGSAFGVYASAPIKALTATAWTGISQRTSAAPAVIRATGTGTTYTVGMGLKAALRFVTLQVGVEHTGQAVARDLLYSYNGQHILIPNTYTPPPVTFAPNTTVRFGVGFNLSFLPASQQRTAASTDRAARAKAQRQVLIASKIDASVPVQYHTFIENWAEPLVQYYGDSLLSDNFTWDADKNCLTVKLTWPHFVQEHQVPEIVDELASLASKARASQVPNVQTPGQINVSIALKNEYTTNHLAVDRSQIPHQFVTQTLTHTKLFTAYAELVVDETAEPQVRVLSSWLG